MEEAMDNLSISNIEKLIQFQQAYEVASTRAMIEGYDSDDDRHPNNWCRPCIGN
tara:strand:+ start:166 stop:327 length:162 start_codon:yes stop_codon:yes gene_type:complete